MWNWQHPDWANFQYDSSQIQEIDTDFLHNAGFLFGVFEHLSEQEKKHSIVDILATEAITTSAIEGEFLDRESVQASLRRSFGLEVDHRKVPPAEKGISQVLIDLYENFSAPLTHQVLFDWHRKLMNGRTDIQQGEYRSHEEPMQVVSGKIYDPIVHFEAPPSPQVFTEMERFIAWFNDSSPQGSKPLPPVIRAGIAHLYFVSIHPFEDGNGRISRCLAEKALSESLKKPALLSLSYAIEKDKKSYYSALEESNQTLEITPWLLYLTKVVVQSQQYSTQRLRFILQKAKFYDRYQGQLNDRQRKVIARMFLEGFEGFAGGLSAKNYRSIAKTSAATATRDLQDLLKKDVFFVTGSFKSTRYHINFPQFSE